MNAVKVLGRFLLASSVGVLVLLSGVFAAFALSLVFLPDPSSAVRAPGDGFLILEFLAISVVVCVPLSIAAACWVLFRREFFLKQLLTGRGGVSLGR